MNAPAGLVVYFRMMADNNQLACSAHPNGRSVEVVDRSVSILNESNEVIGLYERDFIATILPIATVGPGASNADKSL